MSSLAIIRHCRRATRTERAERGFSLIELSVTLAVLFVLAGMAAPPVWVAAKREGRTLTVAHLHRLAAALQHHYVDTGQLPASITELVTDAGVAGWSGPYISQESGAMGDYRLDAFGTSIVYSKSSTSATLTCFGFDRTSGGDDDIVRHLDLTPVLASITRDRIELMNAAVIAHLKRMGPTTGTIPLGVPNAFQFLVTQGVVPNDPSLILDGWGSTLISDPPSPTSTDTTAAFNTVEIGSSP